MRRLRTKERGMLLGASITFSSFLGGMAVNEYIHTDRVGEIEDYGDQRDDLEKDRLKDSLEAVCADLDTVSLQAQQLLAELMTSGSQTITTVYPAREELCLAK